MNTIEELIVEMENTPEKFNQLKIILHREHTKLPPEFGREFLYVSSDSFGLVKMHDLTVADNSVILKLEDVLLGRLATFSIEIGAERSPFLLIAWEDVLDIVKQKRKCLKTGNELLDFEF